MRLTDPQVAEAINLLYRSAKEARDLAQDQLDLADRRLTVASALHDLLVDAQSRPLRSVG